MKARNAMPRRLLNHSVVALSFASAALGLAALAWVLYTVASRGAASLSLDFFTHMPLPPGMPGGGLANALVGTLLMTALATAVGVPVGMMAGVYLSEFGKQNKVASLVRFTVNVLMGVPSIIVGLFVYALIVLRMGSFSGWAGAVALMLLMLPVIARTSEDMLSLVPNELREAGLALGAPRWRVTLSVVFRAARKGLLTGLLLAVARVSGETAPLLFTALNSPYWPENLSGPTSNLTVTIFNYAMSPYHDWQQLAWGASLVIMISVLALTLTARWLIRDRHTA